MPTVNMLDDSISQMDKGQTAESAQLKNMTDVFNQSGLDAKKKQ